MRVVVLGAGVIGTTSAWFLRERGHDVTVIERQSAAAMETSFANGGQISVSHVEPWAAPKAPLQILKWLSRPDAPLLFRPTLDPRQWRWGIAFLLECLPSRTRRNMLQILAISKYSGEVLRELRASTGMHYDDLQRGILQVYTDEAGFASAVKAAELVRRYGVAREVKTAEECVAIEPALRHRRDWIAGGTYTATDETGDARKFTQELAARAAQRGVSFRYGVNVASLAREGGAIVGVRVVDGQGREESADRGCLRRLPRQLHAVAARTRGRSGARVPGEGVFRDDSHPRIGCGAARQHYRRCEEDRVHPAGRTAAGRRHGGVVRLRSSTSIACAAKR